MLFRSSNKPRKRWGGIFLSDSDRDRIIAQWLDSVVDDPRVNVSELVKDFLYEYITSEKPPLSTTERALIAMHRELKELRGALRSGDVQIVATNQRGQIRAEEVRARLLEVDD